MSKKKPRKKKEVDHLLAETNDNLPIPAEKKVQPGAKGRNDPARHGNIHPLAVGLRKAKGAIAEILQKAENIEHLKLELQKEFEEAPTKFLRTYELLLRRFELVSGEGGVVRGPVKVYTGVVVQTEREKVQVLVPPVEEEQEIEDVVFETEVVVNE